MKTITNYDQMIAEFQAEWEGSDLDLMQVAMLLQASRAVLQATLKKKPTPNQVIQFSKVIALHKMKKAI